MADTSFKNDARYKKYHAAIEKTLQSFESVGEWADIISFLNRLSKTLNSFQFPVVPEKILVNKRLAQCLNPNLPGGVHQKALEVYDIIFAKIKPEGVQMDLGMYTMGIFQLFEHAATMVKSSLLNLFEKHILPLQNIPCLPSLILSILPGLEDETAECFSRVFDLLTKLKSKDQKNFYQIMWSLMLMTNKHRVAMINFISRDLPAGPHSEKESVAICGGSTRDASLALVAALRDKNPLVVRGVLDLLNDHFPVDRICFEFSDLLLIVKEALLVLLRRDMSLTRRFYIWLGADEHVSDKSLQLLSAAFALLVDEMNQDSIESLQKPFKIIIFIMDRPALSNLLLRDVFYRMTSMLWKSIGKLKDAESIDKVLATANIFFDNVELELAWGQLLNVVDQSFKPECGDLAREVPGLLKFVLEKISLCDDEAKAVHLPMLLVIISKHAVSNGNQEYLQSMWAIFNQVLLIVLEQGKDQVPALEVDRTPGMTMKELIRITEDFVSSGNISLESIPTNFWLQSSMKAVTSANSYFMNVLSDHSGFLNFALKSNELILEAVFKMRDFCLSESEGSQFFRDSRLWINFLMKWCLSEGSKSEYWPEILKFIDLAAEHAVEFVEENSFVEDFLTKLWRTFAESKISVYCAASLVLQLNNLNPSKTENFISSAVSRGELSEKVKSVELFAYTWTLSAKSNPQEQSALFPKVIFQVIGQLRRPHSRLREEALRWLQSAVDFLPSVFDLFFEMIAEALPCIEDDQTLTPEYTKSFNIAQLSFVLDTISTLLEEGDLSLFDVLEERNISSLQELTIVETIPLRFRFEAPFDFSYFAFIVQVTLPYLCAKSPTDFSLTTSHQIESLQRSVCDLLILLVSRDAQAFKSRELQRTTEAVLAVLRCGVETGNFAHNSAYLKLTGLLLGLRNDSIPGRATFTEICCIAITKAENPSALRSWFDFSLKAAELGDSELWSEFIEPQLLASAEKLNRLRCSNAFQDSLLSQTAVYGLEQFALIGIALVSSAAEKSMSPKIKPRRFETFRNALARNTSSSQLQQSLLSDLQSNLTKSISKPLLEIFRSISMVTNFDENTMGKVLTESFARIYNANQVLVLSAILILWNEGENRESLNFLCNLGTSPIGDDFSRNLLHVYRPVLRESSPDYSMETLLDFVLKISRESSGSPSVMYDLANMVNVFIKDVLGSPTSRLRSSIPALLIFSTEVLLKVLSGIPESELSQGKKFNREVSDSFFKLIEFAIGNAVKLVDISYWIEWPVLSDDTEIRPSVWSSSVKQYCKDPFAAELYIILLEHVLPSSLTLVSDQEKYVSLMSTVWNGLVVPVLKGSIRKHFPGLLGAMSLMVLNEQASMNSKIWKRDFIDSLFDLQLFLVPKAYLRLYSVVTGAVIKLDQERLADFLGKSSSTGAAIFLSREIEYSNRISLMKRLCFAVFCSSSGIILQHLSSIQEKLVEVIRLNAGQPCSEVFLLWQILVFKIGPENILGLWPIIMTETIQILDAVLAVQRDRPAKDLSATFIQLCKFIDLTLLMYPASILLYGWNIIPGPLGDSQESLLIKVGKKFSLIDESSDMPTGLLVRSRSNDLKDLSGFMSYLHSRSAFSQRTFSLTDIEQSILADFIETVGDQ